MIPNKGVIILNKALNEDQISTVVRHEILHEYFTHHERTQAFDKAHPDLLPDHDSSNIAGDFDISNRGYTKKDKVTVRTLTLNDKLLSGLVTEDHYPGWEKMTFEEMYEEILKKRKEDKEKIQSMMNKLSSLSDEELKDLENYIDKELFYGTHNLEMLSLSKPSVARFTFSFVDNTLNILSFNISSIKLPTLFSINSKS